MTKKLLLIITIAVLGLLTVKTTLFAQTSGDEAAKKQGITFPVSELGGCNDYTECKSYCDDPANHDACIAFAKRKGFYKESETKPNAQVLEKAKTALGCDSANSCRDFCSKEENFDKCHAFAQSTGLSGGYKEDPRKAQILVKAEETLGCTSYDSCKSFCNDPANRDKCTAFAKSTNLNGGYEYKGPGGCTSAETCANFCKDPANIEVCNNYARSTTTNGNQLTRDQQEATCKSGGGTCTWNNDICSCQGYHSTSAYTPYPTSGTSTSGVGGSYTPYPTTGSYSGNTMSRDQQQAYCQAGGGSCTWNGDTCNCQGYHAPSGTSTTQSTTSQPSQTQQPQATQQTQGDPAAQCASYPGCSWNGSMCQCSPVQGASTVYTQSLWQKILQFLSGR